LKRCATCSGVRSGWSSGGADSPCRRASTFRQEGENHLKRHCILCGATIEDEAAYDSNRKLFVQPHRYQAIIDLLIDSGRYEMICFDHQTDLPSPYRDIAWLNRSALQEQPGKGRHLHKKWPDITAVSRGVCDLVIEEERAPGPDKINRDIEIITACRYLWARNQLYPLRNPTLFVVATEVSLNPSPEIHGRVGHFGQVIVCEEKDFAALYHRYCS